MNKSRNCNIYHLMVVLSLVILYLFGIRADTAAARDSESMIAATECGLSIIPPDNNHSDPYFREIPDLLVDAFLPIPSENRRVSAVCEFALGSKVPYNDNHAARVTFSYAESDYRVRVYYWRKTKKEWKALPTEMNRLSRTAIANVPFDAAIVTVLANESPSHEGIVSWYRHKRYPSGSATNLYPTGTHLTVTNLDNGKSVDVTVTSTWTNTDDRRILDLVSTAFRKIADTRIGLINARIEWKGYENPFDEK